MQPPYPVRKFTVEEYHRLDEAGVLNCDERVELLEGWIVLTPRQTPPEAAITSLTWQELSSLLSSDWVIRVRSAITLADSEAAPDVVAAAGKPRDFLVRHPGPQDIGLVIEVADATLDLDRRHKGRIYARAGLLVYWIINLVAGQIEVYTDPAPHDPTPFYQQQQVYLRGSSVPVILLGQQVAQVRVDDLLPP
jgi:Uma2 family endonuclease